MSIELKWKKKVNTIENKSDVMWFEKASAIDVKELDGTKESNGCL